MVNFKIINERCLQIYLTLNKQEFIKRYILNCLSHEYKDCKVYFLGSEVRTGVGAHRADMVFYVDSYTPVIVVVELKKDANSNAVIQVQNYIKEFKKTKILEKEENAFRPRSHYVGIVAGKWVEPIVKRLVESDMSNSLSYIDFRNNEYKCIAEDKVYYYDDENYWFECQMY